MVSGCFFVRTRGVGDEDRRPADPKSSRRATKKTSGAQGTIRTFRFDYECEIEYEYDFSNLVYMV